MHGHDGIALSVLPAVWFCAHAQEAAPSLELHLAMALVVLAIAVMAVADARAYALVMSLVCVACLHLSWQGHWYVAVNVACQGLCLGHVVGR